MILGISEDWTRDIDLDKALKSIPSSGLYVNKGVHPSITLDNLLSFLPSTVFTFTAWSAESTYNVFLTDYNKINIVTKDGKTYQSIKATNLNQDPATQTDYWLETNIDSLRLKMFLETVKDRVLSDLNLHKRLISNQFLYEQGEFVKTMPNDYVAWVFEPKGSDYVTIRINQISLQKDGTTPVNLFVINQGNLVETITITPDNGNINFENKEVIFRGKGQFMLAMESTDVYVGHSTVNSLKFNGFVAYTAVGIGNTPQAAKYNYGAFGNGIGLNVSAYLDSDVYVDNNLSEFGGLIRATFEFMVFEMFLHNSNNTSSRAQRIQMNDDLLFAELKNMQGETVVRRFHREKKKAIELLEKTFDTQLSKKSGMKIKLSSL
jgi:hypothetical protein